MNRAANRPPRPGRRAFLRGAAATIGLPYLESLVRPGRAHAAAAPARFIAWHVPNGCWRPSWFPAALGPDYQLSPTLEPLAKVKKKLLVFSGIQNNQAAVVTGSHGLGVSGMLTCQRGTKPDINVGVSVDQVYAEHLAKTGAQTPIPSLQLGITTFSYADEGYPAAYNGAISWANAKKPLQPVVNPAVVFDRIFASSATPGQSDAERMRRRALRMSVLDHAREEASRLHGRLGATDRRKLDEYLTGLREVEGQVQRMDTPRAATCIQPAKPASASPFFPTREHVRLMTDLMVLAVKCDATRVISFMMGGGGNSSFTSYPWLGIFGVHHTIAHAKDGVALSKIERWEIEQLAYFCEQLDAIDEGGTTALDSSVVFLSSEIGDGNLHDQEKKPIVLVGSAGGALKSGRHVGYNNEPQSKLFVTLLKALGVPTTSFAGATEPLPGLT